MMANSKNSFFIFGGIDTCIISNYWGRPSFYYLTTLYDHEYMAGIREKLKIIADLRAVQASEARVTA